MLPENTAVEVDGGRWAVGLPDHPALPRVAERLAADPENLAVVLTRTQWRTMLPLLPEWVADLLGIRAQLWVEDKNTAATQSLEPITYDAYR